MASSMDAGAARRGRSFVSLPLLLGGVLLLALAGPRLGAHLALTAGNPGLDTLRRGEMLADAGFERVRRSREATLAWLDLPQARLDLGYLHLRLALLANEHRDFVAARRELDRAIAAFDAGLAREPVDPFAWHELAYAHLYAGRSRPAATALAMSYRTGRVVPSLSPSRARLVLLLWDLLDPRWQPWALRDLARAWRGRRQELETFARSVGLEDRLRDLVGRATGGYAF